jgi:rSAM/selenodomain-associated transferase 1
VGARRAAAWPRGVAVVVLAKYPTPGRVKTRLAARIGTEAAAALYGAFVRDLARRLRVVGCPVWWAVTPAGAPFMALVRSRRCFPQRGRDLGARMDHATRVVAERTGGAIIVLGADAPHVPARTLLAAARALARGADVVLGPAADGGYWMIGVGRPCRALFEDVAWSTPGVAAATRRRIRRLGLRCVEVATGWDVDDPRDLVRLARTIRGRPAEFPHTRAALARLSRRAG